MWRGPNHDGIAPGEDDVPVKLGSPKWEEVVQGRSHGSLVLRGDYLYFTMAVSDDNFNGQYLVCARRNNGTSIWAIEIHSGGMDARMNKKSTWASTTPAVDDLNVYVNFLNDGKVWTTAVDHEGSIRWQTEICPYQIHQGYGSSPILYRDLVLVSADNKLGGTLCGIDRKTGEHAWLVGRAELPNYPSPVVVRMDGKDQLIMTGTEKVSSFDPLTGEQNWEVDGATTECVTSAVSDGKHVFTSGGYPKNHVAAVVGDGSGKVAWEKPNRVYVPSMIVHQGCLFAIMDAGVAVCWDCETGEEKWKARLGGTFSSSPVLAGGKIYAANESGTLYVFEANPVDFKLLAENRIADEIYSSPAISNGEIFLRVANYSGEERTEKIVCFGK